MIIVALCVLSTDAVPALLVLKFILGRQCVFGRTTDEDLVRWEVLFEDYYLLGHG